MGMMNKPEINSRTKKPSSFILSGRIFLSKYEIILLKTKRIKR